MEYIFLSYSQSSTSVCLSVCLSLCLSLSLKPLKQRMLFQYGILDLIRMEYLFLSLSIFYLCLSLSLSVCLSFSLIGAITPEDAVQLRDDGSNKNGVDLSLFLSIFYLCLSVFFAVFLSQCSHLTRGRHTITGSWL